MPFLPVWIFAVLKSPAFRYLVLFVVGIIACWHYVYLPVYHRGYEAGIKQQQVTIDNMVRAREEEIQSKNRLIEELEKNARNSVDAIRTEKEALEKSLAGTLANYRTTREKLLAEAKKNGAGKIPGTNVPLIENGIYYAPIETAGLSKPGVDAVNQYLQDASK